MDSVFDDQDGPVRSFSNTHPMNYKMKIQFFSLLSKNEVEKYESREFEAGGYKWKLVLYPNGNKRKSVQDHISLYLAMADTSSLPFDWELCVVFQFFLLDQNRGKYLIIKDASEKEKCFHQMKFEWGFDQFIHLKQFNDPCNGYLMEDTCVFGAEVFVTKETSSSKGQCLSMISDAPSVNHFWTIQNFSKLDAESYDSGVFDAGGQKWKIVLYPKGIGRDDYISLFLALADVTAISPASNIYAEFTLKILDQWNLRHMAFKDKKWFRACAGRWGWRQFVSRSSFYLSSTGCLVNDVCFVTADVTVLGIAKEL